MDYFDMGFEMESATPMQRVPYDDLIPDRNRMTTAPGVPVGDKEDDVNEFLTDATGTADQGVLDLASADLSGEVAQAILNLNAVVTASNPKAPIAAQESALAAAESGASVMLQPAVAQALASGILQGLVNGAQKNPELASQISTNTLRQYAQQASANRATLPTMGAVNAQASADFGDVLGADIRSKPTIVRTVRGNSGVGYSVAGKVDQAAIYAQQTADGISGVGQTVTDTSVALTGTVAAVSEIANSQAAMQASQDIAKAASSLSSGLGKAGRGIGSSSSSAVKNLKSTRKGLVESDSYKKKKATAKTKANSASKSVKTKAKSASKSAGKKKSAAGKKLKKVGGSARKKMRRGKKSRAEFIGDGYDMVNGNWADVYSYDAHALGEMLIIDELVDCAWDDYCAKHRDMYAGDEMPEGATLESTEEELERRAKMAEQLQSAEVIQTAAGTTVNPAVMEMADRQAMLAAARATQTAIKTGDPKQGIFGGFQDYLKQMVDFNGPVFKSLSNMAGGVWEGGGAVLQYLRRGVSQYWSWIVENGLPWLKESLGPAADSFFNETLPNFFENGIPQLMGMLSQGIDTVGTLLNLVLNLAEVVGALIGVEFNDVHGRGHEDLTPMQQLMGALASDEFHACVDGKAFTYTAPHGDILDRRTAQKLQDTFVAHAFQRTHAELPQRIEDLQTGFSLFGGGKKKKEEVPVQSPNPYGAVKTTSLADVLDRVGRAEDGFKRGDADVAAYAKDLAENITVRLVKVQNPKLHREMMRAIIQFLVRIVSEVGDLNTSDGRRLFEAQATKTLGNIMLRIRDLQIQRDRKEKIEDQAAAAQRLRALQTQRAALDQQLTTLTGDAFTGGMFDSVKGLFGGDKKKKKKKKVEEPLPPEVQAKIDEQLALQKIELAKPENVRAALIVAGAKEILAMAWDDATTRDMRVFTFLEMLMNAMTGGNYQGGSADEQQRLLAAIKMFGAALLYVMSSPDEAWTDEYLSLLVQSFNAPIFNISEQIAELRKYTKGVGLTTEENDFEVDEVRERLGQTERNAPPAGPSMDGNAFADLDSGKAFLTDSGVKLNRAVHVLELLKNKSVPTGHNVHVLGDVFPETVVVAAPGATVGRTLSGESVDIRNEGEFVPCNPKSALHELATPNAAGHRTVRGRNCSKRGAPYKNNSKIFFYQLE